MEGQKLNNLLSNKALLADRLNPITRDRVLSWTTKPNIKFRIFCDFYGFVIHNWQSIPKTGGEERNSTEYSIINTGYPLFQETKKSKELDN